MAGTSRPKDTSFGQIGTLLLLLLQRPERRAAVPFLMIRVNESDFEDKNHQTNLPSACTESPDVR